MNSSKALSDKLRGRLATFCRPCQLQRLDQIVLQAGTKALAMADVAND